MPIVTALLLLLQAVQPPLIDRLKDLSDPAAVRAVKDDPAATRRRSTSFWSASMRPCIRIASALNSGGCSTTAMRSRWAHGSDRCYAAATGDRAYARRFKARQQRLAGRSCSTSAGIARRSPRCRLRSESHVRSTTPWLEVITSINIGVRATGARQRAAGAGRMSAGGRPGQLARCQGAGPGAVQPRVDPSAPRACDGVDRVFAAGGRRKP